MNFEYTYGSHLVWTILVITLVVIYYAFKDVFKQKRFRLLVIFRLASFALLIFLFLDPRIQLPISKTKELPWNIYIDKSLSMAYHSKPSTVSLISGIDNFINQLDRKKIKKIKYLLLGLKLIQIGLKGKNFFSRFNKLRDGS